MIYLRYGIYRKYYFPNVQLEASLHQRNVVAHRGIYEARARPSAMIVLLRVNITIQVEF